MISANNSLIFTFTISFFLVFGNSVISFKTLATLSFPADNFVDIVSSIIGMVTYCVNLQQRKDIKKGRDQ